MRLHHLIHPSIDWLDEPSTRRVLVVAGVVVAGMTLYGFAVGYWRSPLMGWYVAIKMPLLIGLTLAFNAVLNGLLAMLLGSGLGLRQSFLALLTSFAIMALILGSLAPVVWLMAWNAPPPDSPDARVAHNVYLLTHTFPIQHHDNNQRSRTPCSLLRPRSGDSPIRRPATGAATSRTRVGR